MPMTKKLLFLASLIITACIGGNKQGFSQLEERIDSLQKENNRKDKDINDMTTYVSLLADGLDSIAKQEDMLFYTNKGREGTIVDKDQLKKNLDMFEETLNRQKQRITQLADSLKARGENLTKLSQLVTYLNKQIDEKNSVINKLREDLQNKNVNISQLQRQVTALTEDNAQLSQKVETQVKALNTQTEIINEGYVKIGTKKALSDLGIISGGFLKKKKVNPNAIQQGQFMHVDIRYFKEIPLNSGDPKILTQMPISSYKITKVEKNKSVLYILDPTSFWSISNYLIIQL
jgi:DNA repair exonuclease SbcCD ATPase subunit